MKKLLIAVFMGLPAVACSENVVHQAAPTAAPTEQTPIEQTDDTEPTDETKDAAKPAGTAKKEAAKDIPPPTVSITRQTGTFGGTRIAYRAIAGETYLKDKDGTPTASITSYSYIKEGPVDPRRPV